MLTKSDIDWLKDEYLRSLADEIEKRLSVKLNDVSTKLDTFVSEIQKRRDEDTVHAGDHSQMNDRLDTIEKQLNIASF